MKNSRRLPESPSGNKVSPTMISIREDGNNLTSKENKKPVIKVLNAYAGLGGNRKLWENVEVTAIEIDPMIANIYKEFFPNDKVVVGDAHQYILEHYQEFDFIWSSIPCITHSTLALMCGLSNDQSTGNFKKRPCYPDMKLYEEVIFLHNYYKGLWVVENVKSYYEPLIKPQEIQRHFFWCNFNLHKIKLEADNIKWGKIDEWQERFGFYLNKYTNLDKRKALRNCVHPKLGLSIFNAGFKQKQMGVFDYAK